MGLGLMVDMVVLAVVVDNYMVTAGGVVVVIQVVAGVMLTLAEEVEVHTV